MKLYTVSFTQPESLCLQKLLFVLETMLRSSPSALVEQVNIAIENGTFNDSAKLLRELFSYFK